MHLKDTVWGLFWGGCGVYGFCLFVFFPLLLIPSRVRRLVKNSNLRGLASLRLSLPDVGAFSPRIWWLEADLKKKRLQKEEEWWRVWERSTRRGQGAWATSLSSGGICAHVGAAWVQISQANAYLLFDISVLIHVAFLHCVPLLSPDARLGSPFSSAHFTLLRRRSPPWSYSWFSLISEKPIGRLMRFRRAFPSAVWLFIISLSVRILLDYHAIHSWHCKLCKGDGLLFSGEFLLTVMMIFFFWYWMYFTAQDCHFFSILESFL